MKQLIALAALPMIAAPAMAAPYVESKTTGAMVDGDYTGAQTELRVGYEQKLENGITLSADIVTGKQIGRAHVELQSPEAISYAVFCLKKKK